MEDMGRAGVGPTGVSEKGSDCYTGAQGTENVGACKGGATLCQADGMSYGPCLGEVIPIVEECSTAAVDDDCNGMVNEHCGLWAKRISGTGDQYVYGVATDSAGNVLITGRATGAPDFGGGVLTTTGGFDIFIAKYDKDGQHVWSKLFGGATDDEGLAIAVDGAGNSFITGYFTGMMTIGAANVTALDLQDAYVIKLDSMGGVLGYTIMDGLGDQRGNAIAVDGAGSAVFATGTFATELNTSLGKLTAVDLLDGFVAKYQGDLMPQWQKSFGGVGNDEGSSIAIDSANNVYLTGYYDETVDFGGGVITDGGSYDVFWAKLDSSGVHVLSKGFPVAGDQTADSIGVDTAGNIYIAGEFDTGIDMGGGQVAALGGDDVFLTKFSSAGTHVFTKTYGDPGNQFSRALTVDKAGDVIVALAHEGTVDYGGGPITNVGAAGTSDIVVFKLKGTTGAHLWSRRFGNTSDQDVRCLATDGMNNIFVGGDFYGTINVGVTTISPSSSKDGFLIKLPP